MQLPTLAILVAVGVTIWAFCGGVAAMVSDGRIANRDSAHWMTTRVLAQAAAIALLLVAASSG